MPLLLCLAVSAQQVGCSWFVRACVCVCVWGVLWGLSGSEGKQDSDNRMLSDTYSHDDCHVISRLSPPVTSITWQHFERSQYKIFRRKEHVMLTLRKTSFHVRCRGTWEASSWVIYQGFSWLWQALYNYQLRDALSHVVRGQEATLWALWQSLFTQEFQPTVGGGSKRA